jgi:hypothetical protein
MCNYVMIIIENHQKNNHMNIPYTFLAPMHYFIYFSAYLMTNHQVTIVNKCKCSFEKKSFLSMIQCQLCQKVANLLLFILSYLIFIYLFKICRFCGPGDNVMVKHIPLIGPVSLVYFHFRFTTSGNIGRHIYRYAYR